jgi:DNA replication protein DnaC
VNSTTLERLQEQMQGLKLVRAAAELSTLLQEASKRELSYADFLQELVDRELVAKQEHHKHMKTAMARFPFQETLESFDFKFQPSIDVKAIKELVTGRFIANAENVLLLGLQHII